MAEQWFRTRPPERGTGFDPVHWKGWIVVFAFGAGICLAVIGPILLGGGTFLSLAIGITLVVALAAMLVAIVRRHGPGT